MRKLVAIFTIILATSLSLNIFAGNDSADGLIIPKRPPINDDGPGGIGK